MSPETPSREAALPPAGGAVRRFEHIVATPLLVLADPDGQEIGVIRRDEGPSLP